MCLFNNGKLLYAASEERFSRKKMDDAFPCQSIEFILKECKLNLHEINSIAYAWGKGFEQWLLPMYIERASKMRLNSEDEYKIFCERIEVEIERDSIKKDEFRDWAVRNLTKEQYNKIFTAYHHEAHAASAALLSPFDNGLVLTADGRGDFEAITVWQFERNSNAPLTKVYSSTSSDSLGFLYGRITGMLGFKPERHEGKITGLAAYGNPTNAMHLMEKMMSVENGQLIAHLGDYYMPYFSPYSDFIKNEIAKYSREDIAAAVQKHLENIVCAIITHVISELKLEKTNLMLAGGVFANVKANQALKELPFISSIFVQPQMGDGGLCLGAAALAQHKDGYNITPIENMYFGPDINANDFLQRKSKYHEMEFQQIHDVATLIVNDLQNKKVVGLIRGRMEFGPRALCHRTILCWTSDVSINDWLNKRMHRTEFMPFAPIVRAETAKIAFKNFSDKDVSLNYMTSTINCTEQFVEKSPAVVHVDKTARPQIVTQESDNLIWNILKKWEEISGEMALVNTSFNAHEEPIINTPEEGMNAVSNGMVDVLYVDNVRVVKRI
ncbi:carbamoyltransferase [Spirochaetia bacterium]|nr:carbamoyltransferase [Spirochaetia bacterium]